VLPKFSKRIVLRQTDGFAHAFQCARQVAPAVDQSEPAFGDAYENVRQ